MKKAVARCLEHATKDGVTRQSRRARGGGVARKPQGKARSAWREEVQRVAEDALGEYPL